MARMFGTDGVRGVAGSELTIELATKLGQAGAYVLTKEQEHQATIIVGCDTRISGGMLASALMAGICSEIVPLKQSFATKTVRSPN